MVSDSHAFIDIKYTDWRAEDAQILSFLWNSMDPWISSTLDFIDFAKLVWEQTQELYSSVSNLCPIYQLHQSYFSIQ